VGMLTLADLKRNGFIRCQSLNPIRLSCLDPKFDDEEKDKNDQATPKEPTKYRFLEHLISTNEVAERFPNWRDGLPLACDVLKYWVSFVRSSGPDRAEIYELKNDMVKLLVTSGYCTKCYTHLRTIPDEECGLCVGTGESTDEEGYAGKCQLCNGSGFQLRAQAFTLVCFEFLVGGKQYYWYQPLAEMNFAYKLIGEAPSRWQHDDSQWSYWTDPRMPWQEHKSFLRWIILEADAETYLKPYNGHDWNAEPGCGE
jgi:hypothetical protein